MAGLTLVSALLRLAPTLFYLENCYLHEWMFYRFAFAGMVGTIAVTLLCATIVSEHVSALTLMRYERYGAATRGLWRYETLKTFMGVSTVLFGMNFLPNWPGVRELLSTGHVTIHWSRVMLGAFFAINLAQVLGTLCTLRSSAPSTSASPLCTPRPPTPVKARDLRPLRLRIRRSPREGDQALGRGKGILSRAAGSKRSKPFWPEPRSSPAELWSSGAARGRILP